jgi:hypothetical protein
VDHAPLTLTYVGLNLKTGATASASTPLTLPDGQPMAMSLRTVFGQPMEGQVGGLPEPAAKRLVEVAARR